MCLAIPAKVLSVDEMGKAVIDLGGVRRNTSLALVPDAAVGDFVLIHAGYAIQKLEEQEAYEILDILAQVARAADEELGSAEGRDA
jgi:hydrogenase expression/formation protein HypC